MPKLLILLLSDLCHLAETDNRCSAQKINFSGENEECCLLLF